MKPTLLAQLKKQGRARKNSKRFALSRLPKLIKDIENLKSAQKFRPIPGSFDKELVSEIRHNNEEIKLSISIYSEYFVLKCESTLRQMSMRVVLTPDQVHILKMRKTNPQKIIDGYTKMVLDPFAYLLR